MLYLHDNVAFTFKYGNTWNKTVYSPKDLNWVQQRVRRIGPCSGNWNKTVERNFKPMMRSMPREHCRLLTN